MAITFVGVSNAAGQAAGSAAASTVSITPTMPASAVDKNRIFVFVAGTVASGTTPTGWNVVGTKDTILGSAAASSGAGQRRGTWYWRDYNGVWTMPAFTLVSAANNSHWIGAVAIQPTAGKLFDTPTITTVGGAFNTATTSYTDTSAASFTTISGGFLLVGTGFNDNVTSSAAALTQTGATFGTVTERCDGGTATGFIVSGKIHTAPVTTGASATITHTETISASSQGETLIVQQTESTIPAKAETLTDDFNSADTAKWDFDASASVTGGQLQITRLSPGFVGADSDNRYDLTESYALVQVPQVLNNGTGTTQIRLILEWDANNYFMLSWQAGGIYADYWLVGTQTNTFGDTYNATDHLWWRIRESGGTIFWDTSADGSTWTNRASVARPFSVTSMRVYLRSGYYGTETSPGTAILDKFNITAQAFTSSPTDLIGIIDSVVKDLGRTQTDSIGIADSVVKDLGRTQTDLVGITDSVANDVGRTVTDTVGLLDSVATVQDWTRSQTDLVGITDSLTVVVDRTQTDLIGITDSVASQQGWVRSQIDLVGITDSSTIEVGRTQTDSVGISDSVASQQDWIRSQTDLVGLSDSLAVEVSHTQTDSVDISDSVASQQDWSRSQTDLVGIVDSIEIQQDWVRSLDDGVGIGDSIELATEFNRELDDDLDLTDQVGVQQDWARTLTDVVDISDSMTFTVAGAGELVLDDAIDLTDSLTFVSDSARTLTDLIGLSDSITVNMIHVNEVTDNVELTDDLTFAAGYVRALTDPIGIVDSISFQLNVQPTDFEIVINDVIGLHDSVTARFVGGSVASRTVVVLPETRTVDVRPENRTVDVRAESRTVDVRSETRSVNVAYENRTVVPRR